MPEQMIPLTVGKGWKKETKKKKKKRPLCLIIPFLSDFDNSSTSPAASLSTVTYICVHPTCMPLLLALPACLPALGENEKTKVVVSVKKSDAKDAQKYLVKISSYFSQVILRSVDVSKVQVVFFFLYRGCCSPKGKFHSRCFWAAFVRRRDHMMRERG